MRFNLRNKKIIIFGAILALVTVAVGGFFLWEGYKKPRLKEPISKNIFLKANDYEIIETSSGKIVECKKESFKVSVPTDWTVEKDEAFDMGIYLFSPEVGDSFIKNAKEKGACGMAIEIYNSEKVNPGVSTFADELASEINRLKENPDSSQEEGNPKSEVILVNNRSAIRRTYSQGEQVRAVEVETLVDQTVYHFESGLIINQNCVEEFNKILTTVFIEK